MTIEWRKLTDRIKRDSDLSPANEPKWCKNLNDFFAERHENLVVNQIYQYPLKKNLI